MLPTTTLVVITPLARRLLIKSLTEFENFLTIVPVFKVFLFSTLLVVVLDLDSLLSSWNVSLLTMARKLNSNSLSTQHHKFQQQLLNHTTQFSRPIPPWSTLTVPSWLITKPFMISARRILVLSDHLMRI